MHTWGKSEGPGGIRLSFILSVTGFFMPMALLLLTLRPPEQPVFARVPSAASAQSFQAKMSRLQQMQARSAPADDVRVSADEISSAFAQSDGEAVTGTPLIDLHDDLVTGQFVAKVAGQQVYITVTGHLGVQDGYVTFEPTNFKLGDLNIPVALVNPALQRKLREQREQLKLPEFVSDLRVQNGELIIHPK